MHSSKMGWSRGIRSQEEQSNEPWCPAYFPIYRVWDFPQHLQCWLHLGWVFPLQFSPSENTPVECDQRVFHSYSKAVGLTVLAITGTMTFLALKDAIIILILCMCFTSLWVCTLWAYLIRAESEEGARYLRIRVKDGCEQPRGCWELNPHPW